MIMRDGGSFEWRSDQRWQRRARLRSLLATLALTGAAFAAGVVTARNVTPTTVRQGQTDSGTARAIELDASAGSSLAAKTSQPLPAAVPVPVSRVPEPAAASPEAAHPDKRGASSSRHAPPAMSAGGERDAASRPASETGTARPSPPVRIVNPGWREAIEAPSKTAAQRAPEPPSTAPRAGARQSARVTADRDDWDRAGPRFFADAPALEPRSSGYTALREYMLRR
jgi:hypothetical protein